MLYRVVAALAVWFVAAPGAASARDLVGPAQVVDGDSLMVAGREVRMAGIDAPEWDQKCALPSGETWMPGQEAAAWMASLVEGKAVACKVEKRDRYGRSLATCYLDGVNLSELAARQGWAMAYRRYSSRYVSAEDEARQSGRGLWRGKCAEPETWRHNKGGQ